MNHKKMWQWVGLAIIGILIIGVAWYYLNSRNNIIVPVETAKTHIQPENTPKQNNPVNTPTTTRLSYADAVKLYEGKRIQFTDQCIATPYYVTFTEGTKIMLDNRAKTTQNIYLDGVKYVIPGYDYKIVTVSTPAKLPHDMRVDCGNGKGNATILIQ